MWGGQLAYWMWDVCSERWLGRHKHNLLGVDRQISRKNSLETFRLMKYSHSLYSEVVKRQTHLPFQYFSSGQWSTRGQFWWSFVISVSSLIVKHKSELREQISNSIEGKFLFHERFPSPILSRSTNPVCLSRCLGILRPLKLYVFVKLSLGAQDGSVYSDSDCFCRREDSLSDCFGAIGEPK